MEMLIKSYVVSCELVCCVYGDIVQLEVVLLCLKFCLKRNSLLTYLLHAAQSALRI